MPTDRLTDTASRTQRVAMQTAPAATVDELPTLLTILEAAERLRVSRSTVYTLLQRGELRGVRVGRRRFVAVAEIAAFLRNGYAA